MGPYHLKGKAAAALFPFHRFYLARWEGDRITPGGVVVPGRWALRRLGAVSGRGAGPC
jgi:hypothetical protein